LLTQNILNNIEVNVPELVFQQKIASILSSLDKKIQSNTKINDNLAA
jgi:type I restriction enzyme S subunit